MSRSNNTLSIVALVLGILGAILAIIPCTSIFGLVLGVIGVILGLMGYNKTRDQRGNTAIPITGTVLSFIAIVISGYMIYTFSNFVSDLNDDITIHENCESLIADIEATKKRIQVIDENDNPGFSAIKEATSVGVRIAKLAQQAEELGCDIEAVMEDDYGSSPSSVDTTLNDIK